MQDFLFTPVKNLSSDGMPMMAQTDELECKELKLLLGQQSISLELSSKIGVWAKS